MELDIIKAIQSLGSDALDIFCKVISHLSSYIGFFFLLVIFFVFYKKRFALTFGITYGISVAFNYLLKFLVGRQRPYVVDPNIINKMSAVGQSFPSGHTLSATIMSCFLVFWIIDKVKNKWLRAIFIALICIFLLLVIFSRIYLGQHYLTDTVAGLILGIIYSCIALFIMKKNHKSK